MAGKAQPPFYIISSSAKDEANFCIDLSICKGLPVKAKYAWDTYRDHSSFIVVCHTGSMDTPLWHDLNWHIYLPCYEDKILKEPMHDPITQKLLSGPLIVKTNAGPGCLSDKDDKVWNSMLKWLERECTFSFCSPKEMENTFEKYQPRCHKSIQRVTAMKMAARVRA